MNINSMSESEVIEKLLKNGKYLNNIAMIMFLSILGNITAEIMLKRLQGTPIILIITDIVTIVIILILFVLIVIKIRESHKLFNSIKP